MASSRSPFLLLLLVFSISICFGSLAEARAVSLSPFASSWRRMLRVGDAASYEARRDGDTTRMDPLMHLDEYRGGYNLTNRHYWSSLILTGVSGYAIGISWLVVGATFGLFLAFTKLCVKEMDLQKTSTSSSNGCYQWFVAAAIFLTVLAIVAVGLVLGGSTKFHARASTIVEIIMDTANDASKTIQNTTGAMEDIKDTLESSSGSTETTLFLTTMSQKLDDEAGKIEMQARRNRRLIDKGLKIVYIITTATISSILVAIVALSVSGSFRLRQPLYWLISLCWLLTALCWMFFGMYFFLDKFSTDTCTALDNFQEDPNNSSLSSILPCDKLLSAKSVLSGVGAGVYDLVNQVNANISLLQMTTHMNLLFVCNPFSAPPEYSYQPNECPTNTIRIGDIPKVLRAFACIDPNNGSCTDMGIPISSSEYKTVEDYTTSVQGLLDAYPGMESLIECQSVKDAFSRILVDHCGPLKRYVRMVWSAAAFLAAIMVVVVLVWTVAAIRDRHLPESNSSSRGRPAHATKAREIQKIDR
ncbi:hypothetical protein MLD38_035707 [Melastoma candidum]|uniref:Uncharacterized protein n=1 Tax=Melastoma candidum TaxID=119954 RepID=A0ACB9LHC8_9MYRT|nr:hypothetical protein MLD38_035707 [Melastoma candidum]